MPEAMPPRSDPACDTCRFWRQGPIKDRGPDWGECRRMPPTLPPIEQEKLLHVGIWPHTAAEDWCGEWQSGDEPGPSDGGADPALSGPT